MENNADYIRYNALVSRIKDLNTFYYLGEPEVSDPEYDGLFMEMKSLEKKLGLSEEQSQSNIVGHVQGTFLEEHLHRKPMLSLQTEVDSSVLGFKNFDNRVRRELSIPNNGELEYISEVKFDGIGLNLQYNKGILSFMLSRGDGAIGEDVTHAISVFGDYIKTDISKYYPFDIEIRGEGIMTLSDFKDLNTTLEQLGQKLMANPRNAASGTVRTFDLEKIKNRKLVFFPYSIGNDAGPGLGNTHSEVMANLFKFGFSQFLDGGYVSSTFGNENDVAPYNFFLKMQKERENLGIEIDGIVHKVNRLDYQEKLGFRSREPRWAVAQKFPPATKLTTLYAIETQIGRTGKLTPVGKVMPVQVGGTVVSSATLHNVFDLRRRNVRVGDIITIQRAGDVIPEIAYRIKDKPRLFYSPNFHFPKICPSCGSPVKRLKGEVDYYCTGKNICKEQIIGSILHFADKKHMNIQGLGEATIRYLVEAGVLKSYIDIYTLSKGAYDVQGNLGPLMADKLYAAIEASKNNYAWQFLSGLGIKEIGVTYSKLLCKLHTLEALAGLGWPTIVITTGLGPSASKNLVGYFKSDNNYKIFYAFLVMFGKKFRYTDQIVKKHNLQIVFTGSFKNHNRDQLKNLVESGGGKASSSVSSKTNYVVIGDSPTQHKVDKANSLNIPVITIDEFENILKGF